MEKNVLIKVMFFNRSFFGGGVEKVLLDIIKSLDKTKYDVTVYVRSKNGNYKDEYERINNQNIHIRSCYDWMTPGESFLGKCKNVFLQKLGEGVIYRFPYLYYKIAIREKYDVEIAFMHNEAVSVISSSINKESKKIAWIHSDLRKLDSYKYYFGSRKRQEKILNKFDHIVCVSKNTENILSIFRCFFLVGLCF